MHVAVLVVLAVGGLAASAAGAGITHFDPPPRFAQPLVDPAASRSPGPSLPDKWCGTVRSTDDVDHQHGPDQPRIKFGLAMMVGQELDPRWLGIAQKHARLIHDHVLAESGGRKSIRFDLGTDCGPGYLDIAVVHVTKASISNGPPCPDDFAAVDAMASKGRPFNFLIFYPHCEAGGGHALMEDDDSDSPSNENNAPGRWGIVYGDYPATTLHEIGHTLGAVNIGAPHTDGTAHCWDHADIMCYPYTQMAPQSPVRPCEWGAVLDPFDCGKDDYFNPDPPDGSYIDTHWNLYDSVFMCVAEECVPQPAPPAPPAPVTTPAPAPAPPAASRPAKRAKPAAKRCRRLKTRRARARCVRRAAKRRAGR